MARCDTVGLAVSVRATRSTKHPGECGANTQIMRQFTEGDEAVELFGVKGPTAIGARPPRGVNDIPRQATQPPQTHNAILPFILESHNCIECVP